MSDLPAMMYDLEDGVRQEAGDALMRILGTEDGGRLSAQVAVAFRQAVASAKKPVDLLNCSRESISNCVLQVVLTGITP